MYSRDVTIEHFFGDPKKALIMQKWTFRFWDSTHPAYLRLIAYAQLTRPTTRHKWQVDDNYDTYNSRSCSIKNPENVPLPNSVIDEARKEFIENLADIEVKI